MKEAYELAVRAVRQRYAEQHPELLEGLTELAERGVAVYEGTYDQAEELFKVLGIKVTTNRVHGESVVVVNCSSAYPPELAMQAARWVEKGKTLITSDWAVHYVLEKAFPGKLRWTNDRTGDDTVGVEPELDSIWSEVVVLGADPRWWVWGSYAVEVLDPRAVTVEARSHDMMVKYGSPVVAARFAHGKGLVYHAVGHFWAKKSGTPSALYAGPAEEFLRRGMRLSEEGVRRVLHDGDHGVNFACLQSAVTATALVAQLGVRSLSRA